MSDITSNINPRSPLGPSITSGAANIGSTLLNFGLQKQLNADRYNQYISAMRSVGASPASIVAGLTGSGTGSMPTVSTGNNPFPDFGANQVAQQNADVNQQNANTEERYKNMLLTYEPKLFRSQAFEATAKAFRDMHGIKLDEANSRVANETAQQIAELRPWNLKQAEQTFYNLQQEYRESQSRERLNNEKAKTEKTQQALNTALTEESYSRSFLTNQEAFRTMWENSLRSIGYNPNKSYWDNLFQLASKSPALFEQRVDTIINSIHRLENSVWDNSSKTEKVLGGYLVGRAMRKQRDANKQQTFSNLISIAATIAKFL